MISYTANYGQLFEQKNQRLLGWLAVRKILYSHYFRVKNRLAH